MLLLAKLRKGTILFFSTDSKVPPGEGSGSFQGEGTHRMSCREEEGGEENLCLGEV